MSSSPSANELTRTKSPVHCCYDDEIHVGKNGSLLYSKQSKEMKKNNGSLMLSNESCDVVLQTTSYLGRGGYNGTLRRQVSSHIILMLPKIFTLIIS